MSNSTPTLATKRTHEAYYAKDIFESGIGWVILARFKSGGQRIETGVFCVDAWCLGVKRAAFDEWSAQSYRSQLLDHYFSRFPMTEIAPCCARKLVETATAYAARLGFAPHPDYKKACRVFGGIRAEECRQEFVFGKGGKPFYMRGPGETEARARQIVRQLDQCCGAGNYDYAIALGTVEELNRQFAD
ncbi:MAG: hypothetical protein ACYDH9_18290 [Limisphaerales bacterium]